MSAKATLNDCHFDIGIIARNPDLAVKVGQALHTIKGVRGLASGEFEMTIDGRVRRGWRFTAPDGVYVHIDGHTHIVGLARTGGIGASDAHAVNEVRADMPGTVVALHVGVGDEVTSGQKLVTIESMKLQIGVVAPRDGTIAKLHVLLNSTFDRGAILVSLVPGDGEKE